jgi:hypothetical protein
LLGSTLALTHAIEMTTFFSFKGHEMVARFHINIKPSVQQWPHTLTVLNHIAPLPRHKSLTKAEGESKDLQSLSLTRLFPLQSFFLAVHPILSRIATNCFEAKEGTQIISHISSNANVPLCSKI